MHSSPHPSLAASGHFIEAERLLASLPLVKRDSDKDREVQIALVNALLSIAAVVIGDDGARWQTISKPEDSVPDTCRTE